MQPVTKASLSQLESADWFAHVGEPLGEGVVQVRSWMDAVAICGSKRWEEVSRRVVEGYQLGIRQVSLERWQMWETIAAELKSVTDSLVVRGIKDVARRNALPGTVQKCVEWDIFHFAMECEYSDIMPLGFYTAHSYFYSIGHFPCGWDGDLPPDGHVMVY